MDLPGDSKAKCMTSFLAGVLKRSRTSNQRERIKLARARTGYQYGEGNSLESVENHESKRLPLADY